MLRVGSVLQRKARLSEAASSSHKRSRKKPLAVVTGKENVYVGSIPSDLTDPKEYKHLLKECRSLQKQLDEMKESLKSSEVELHKFREAFHMEQVQNRQLALANSHLLEELNSGRDRIKAIVHELGCTRAMLKAKHYEINLKQETCAPSDIAANEKPVRISEVAAEEEGSLPAESTDRKLEFSSGLKNEAAQVTGKKKSRNHRRKTVRRRSCILRHQRCEPIGELFELDDIGFPIRSQKMEVPTSGEINDPAPMITQDASPSPPSESATPEIRCEDLEVMFAFSANKASCGNFSPPPSAADHQLRSPIGRPARRAKVGVSYKERPINVKMRREA